MKQAAGWTMLITACMLTGACEQRDRAAEAAAPADTLTRAQRDSAIARSRLPGARGVGRAQDVAGAAQQRATQLDTLQ